MTVHIEDGNGEDTGKETAKNSNKATKQMHKHPDDTPHDEHKKKGHPTKKELAAQLDQAEEEKQDLQERLLRTMAEFDNYRKRVTREKQDLTTYANKKFALELLPIADNFELALKQARTTPDAQAVVEGVEMIFKQFMDVLGKFQITPFDSVGEVFDPEKHEAMAQHEHHEFEENTIISEFQRGYHYSNMLLRPARVIVSKGMSVDPDEAQGAEENS